MVMTKIYKDITFVRICNKIKKEQQEEKNGKGTYEISDRWKCSI